MVKPSRWAILSQDEAYRLGYRRGAATGRHEPNAADLAWLADETNGRMQTDLEDMATFAKGMRHAP